MSEIIINKLCIIGVGLIGGSLARALKKAGVVGEVVGAGRDVSHLKKAKALGVIDQFETDIPLAVKGCDMVVLAVPLGAMQSVFEKIAPVITNDMIITDVGSAKASVVKAAQAAFKTIPDTLVPAHPIAGTEKSGVEASFPELYENRRIIITPLETSSVSPFSSSTSLRQSRMYSRSKYGLPRVFWRVFRSFIEGSCC